MLRTINYLQVREMKTHKYQHWNTPTAQVLLNDWIMQVKVFNWLVIPPKTLVLDSTRSWLLLHPKIPEETLIKFLKNLSLVCFKYIGKSCWKGGGRVFKAARVRNNKCSVIHKKVQGLLILDIEKSKALPRSRKPTWQLL